MKLDVGEVVGVHCIASEDGEQVFERVQSALDRRDERVVLDFGAVEIVASPFFNALVGALMEAYETDEINSRVEFANLSGDGRAVLQRVIDNARDYYTHPKVREYFDHRADDSLG